MRIVKTRALRHVVASYLLMAMFAAQPLTASAQARAGAKCFKAGKIIETSGSKFVCAKSNKKLVWTFVTSTVTTTTTIATTTTTTATTSTTVKPVVATTVAVSTTISTTVAVDKTPPIVTLLRGAGSSSSSTLAFTVTGDEAISCSTLSASYDVDFTWDKISIITIIAQTSPTVCTITAYSTAERDNDDHLATLRASAGFSISDSAGNVQTRLLGSPQSTTVKRA